MSLCKLVEVTEGYLKTLTDTARFKCDFKAEGQLYGKVELCTSVKLSEKRERFNSLVKIAGAVLNEGRRYLKSASMLRLLSSATYDFDYDIIYVSEVTVVELKRLYLDILAFGSFLYEDMRELQGSTDMQIFIVCKQDLIPEREKVSVFNGFGLMYTSKEVPCDCRYVPTEGVDFKEFFDWLQKVRRSKFNGCNLC